MDNPRFLIGSRDIESMVKLTDKLGKDIWKNAAIVLIRAIARGGFRGFS